MKRSELRRRTPLARPSHPIPRGPMKTLRGKDLGGKTENGQPQEPMPSRSAPVRRVNASRKRKQFARCYHSVERVEFVRGLHCIVFGCNATPCENAHTTGGGMGRKSDYTKIVPLCPEHHREMHAVGAQSFEQRCSGDYREHTVAVERLWQAHQSRASGLSHISDVVPGVVRSLMDAAKESA